MFKLDTCFEDFLKKLRIIFFCCLLTLHQIFQTDKESILGLFEIFRVAIFKNLLKARLEWGDELIKMVRIIPKLYADD